MKIVTLAVAFATAVAPLAAKAAETAVIGGRFAPPPAASPGPGAGVVATPDQPMAPPPPATVGKIPHPAPLSRSPRSCNKTICDNSNGRG